MKYQRNEYPRPNFRREEWQPLNGEWEFAFDDGKEGIKRRYWTGKVAFDKKINVPFTYEYEASGIGLKETHETVWYRRKFFVDRKNRTRNALLCFNASDYITDVWINGQHALAHRGGFTPFSGDITDYLNKSGENVITVRCYDPCNPNVPRGKQSWTGEPFGCWYTPNTGIWQSVWIEYFSKDAISSYTLLPDIDLCSFSGEINTLYGQADSLAVTVFYGGQRVKTCNFSLDGMHTRYTVRLMDGDFVDESRYWTPDAPNLFYVDFELFVGGRTADRAHTRFGMRKISVDCGGNICLNNKKLYQRLVLDQGYWSESGLTPPDAGALKKDIELAKAMGFNGARKHQKFEDPYFYYYAEELGFLTWCEMPSAYNFNSVETEAQSMEWREIVSLARNFTSVICYVPLNESWGVRKILTDKMQQDYAKSLYYITRSIDNGKLISTNDGWENVQPTDIISVHDYAYDDSGFDCKYCGGDYGSLYPRERKLMAEGCAYSGQPLLLTEFGGIALQKDRREGAWGYNDGAKNADELTERLDKLIKGIAHTDFQGYCYTQLTDVQQEVNGLLYADRTPKADMTKLKKIFENKE